MELRDLAKLPLDKLLEMQVSDFELVHCVSKMLHTKRYRSGRDPEDLTPSEALYTRVDDLWREVSNGGFDQYFWNSAGNYWRQARDGFVRLGIEEQLAIYDAILALFPESSPSSEREMRWLQLDGIREKHGKSWDKELNRKLMDIQDSTDAALAGYVRTQRSDFDIASPT